VAVAVHATPCVVLDDQYRVVEMNRAAEAGVGRVWGQDLDSFPDARPLFLPYLKEAERTRRVVRFPQYFEGYVVEVTIEPGEGTFTVTWERLCVLDVLTLEGLRASLAKVLDTLRDREDALRRDGVRRRLRVIEGGQ
jgi:PAS domain-containing protein